MLLLLALLAVAQCQTVYTTLTMYDASLAIITTKVALLSPTCTVHPATIAEPFAVECSSFVNTSFPSYLRCGRVTYQGGIGCQGDYAQAFLSNPRTCINLNSSQPLVPGLTIGLSLLLSPFPGFAPPAQYLSMKYDACSGQTEAGAAGPRGPFQFYSSYNCINEIVPTTLTTTTPATTPTTTTAPPTTPPVLLACSLPLNGAINGSAPNQYCGTGLYNGNPASFLNYCSASMAQVSLAVMALVALIAAF